MPTQHFWLLLVTKVIEITYCWLFESMVGHVGDDGDLGDWKIEVGRWKMVESAGQRRKVAKTCAVPSGDW